VLRHNDVEVILPKQRPAPLPAVVYGDVKTARRDLAYSVKHLAEAVRAGYTIVCSEPSAAMCLREELRHYVAGEDAELVSQNTVELMNYLSDLKKRGKLKPPIRSIVDEYAYHLPCHLCAVGDDTVTLKLLNDHFRIETNDLQAGCCGLSGTFGMQKKNYDLSNRMAERLKTAIKTSSTKAVITECAACKMQIEHLAPTTVTHPIKLLAHCYNL
jgi:Fe-S oxidoreductase